MTPYDIITASTAWAMSAAWKKGKTMTTPGTITAGELRSLKPGNTLTTIGGGEKVHRGIWFADGTNGGIRAFTCEGMTEGVEIGKKPGVEIEYSRLCRHCFPELTKTFKP